MLRVLVNEGWEEGMASSIRLGVGALSGVDGCVVMTCDQPAVTVEHLSRLMMGDEVKTSRYAGRNGIPAFFPAAVFEDLMELRGDKGARELLAGVGFVELEGGELDVDTWGDLARVRELFGSELEAFVESMLIVAPQKESFFDSDNLENISKAGNDNSERQYSVAAPCGLRSGLRQSGRPLCGC